MTHRTEQEKKNVQVILCLISGIPWCHVKEWYGVTFEQVWIGFCYKKRKPKSVSAFVLQHLPCRQGSLHWSCVGPADTAAHVVNSHGWFIYCPSSISKYVPSGASWDPLLCPKGFWNALWPCKGTLDIVSLLLWKTQCAGTSLVVCEFGPVLVEFHSYWILC